MDASGKEQKFDVGGVLLNQPFKIRRLGHFGFNVPDVRACLDFYCDLFGFRISDPHDVGARHPKSEELKKLGDTNIYFMRHGTDHHSFVLFDRNVFDAMGRGDALPADVTVNQMTWQVASLREVGDAIDWFAQNDVKVSRAGRDMPGSNWHVYPYDPEGHRNELYYGIEQIGWSGMSKPRNMHQRGFHERPELPQVPEYEEVNVSLKEGVDLTSGFRHPETLPATYDVGGILLPRPFKVVRHGPVRLFVHDLDALTAFYRDILGFVVTEEITWNGHRCVFLRCNTEHHALALYPIALRDELALSPDTTVMGFGMQVANYRQLRDAAEFLKEKGCTFVDIPATLSPGIDYSFYVRDPAGHPIQVYYYMEQVGWDGKPRPREDRPPAPIDDWPETVEPHPDAFMGETYMGPWG